MLVAVFEMVVEIQEDITYIPVPLPLLSMYVLMAEGRVRDIVPGVGKEYYWADSESAVFL